VNTKHYVETLLPELDQDCRSVLPSDFIFVTFWRLAVIDFELGLDVIVYLFTVLCDFVCWSILDVVDSRMSVNVGHMYN